MTIRKDLKEVEPLVSRLLSIGKEYGDKDLYWAHLKNNEDWSQFIGSFSDSGERATAERVYGTGRDMAISLSSYLKDINFDLTTYPNLTSIVHKFDNGWVYEDLSYIIEEAEKAASGISRYTWAFNEMLKTFNEQLKLAEVVKQTLFLLKGSNLYRLENRLTVKEDNSQNINIAHVTNSVIAVNSPKATQSLHNNDELFDNILEVINVSTIENKGPLISVTGEMREASKTGSLGESYKKFIGLAADHMAILSPFIPALTALL